MANSIPNSEVQNLKDRLDEIAEVYWGSWKTWMQGLGWSLGPDRPDLLMNPYLVDAYGDLTSQGLGWVKAQVALLIHAVSQLASEKPAAPKVKAPSDKQLEALKKGRTIKAAKQAEARIIPAEGLDKDRAVTKLKAALKALDAKDGATAEVKLKSALKAIPEKIRLDQVRVSIQTALKNLDMMIKLGDAKRSRVSLLAALRRLESGLLDGERPARTAKAEDEKPTSRPAPPPFTRKAMSLAMRNGR